MREERISGIVSIGTHCKIYPKLKWWWSVRWLHQQSAEKYKFKTVYIFYSHADPVCAEYLFSYYIKLELIICFSSHFLSCIMDRDLHLDSLTFVESLYQSKLNSWRTRSSRSSNLSLIVPVVFIKYGLPLEVALGPQIALATCGSSCRWLHLCILHLDCYVVVFIWKLCVATYLTNNSISINFCTICCN